MTFEEACEQAATHDAHGVATIQRTMFEQPLRELKELRAGWPKQEAELRTRLDAVHRRVRQAIAAGVKIEDYYQLFGNAFSDLMGEGGRQGLIDFIGARINETIAKMERFDLAQLTGHNAWRLWPSEPGRVRDNMAWAERCMSKMETIVRDGGHLQALVEQVAERKAGNQAVA